MNRLTVIAAVLALWVAAAFLSSTADTNPVEADTASTRWVLMSDPTEHVMIVSDDTAVLLAWGGQAALTEAAS